MYSKIDGNGQQHFFGDDGKFISEEEYIRRENAYMRKTKNRVVERQPKPLKEEIFSFMGRGDVDRICCRLCEIESNAIAILKSLGYVVSKNGKEIPTEQRKTQPSSRVIVPFLRLKR